MNTQGQDIAAFVKSLRHFTSKHRLSFALAGVRALELAKDPIRAKRDLLVVYLQSRPGKTRPETAFFVRTAEVSAIGSFGARTEEIRNHLARSERVTENTSIVTCLVMLWCEDAWSKGLWNIVPVQVRKDDLDNDSLQGDWVEELKWVKELKRLVNSGIVL